MDELLNILDEDILMENLKFASLFILNYECLSDYLVTQMKSFLSDETIFVDGELVEKESQVYKDQVKKYDPKNRNRLTAALLWFKELEAISEDDVKLFYRIRKKRNSITHEFLRELSKGFNEDDIALYKMMVELYSKIDKWWINEIEIPISGEYSYDDYNHDEVFGGEALVLSIISDIVTGNGNEYKEYVRKMRLMYKE